MCVLYVVHLFVKDEDYLNSHLPNHKLETVSLVGWVEERNPTILISTQSTAIAFCG